MNAQPFFADGSDVFWGSVRLSPESVEQLLGIFLREDARDAYWDLHDAYVAAGGIPFTDNRRAA